MEFSQGINIPAVSVALLTIGLIGIAIEVVTQHGIAGIIGLSALGVFFAAHMAANFAEIWFVLLFVLGIGLLLVEIHILPGHGVSGVLGISAILLSLFFSIGGNEAAARQVALSIAMTVVVFVAVLRYLPKAPFFNRLVLRASVETPLAVRRDVPDLTDELKNLVGKTGTAVSELRPSGIVLIEEKRYSAMADGEYIAANTTIKVDGLQGSSLMVRSENHKGE